MTHPSTFEDDDQIQFNNTSLAFRMLGNHNLVLGAVIFGVVAVLAVILPLVLNLEPLSVSPRDRLQPPSFEHILGTDQFGRDLLARLIYGAQTSLMLGASVAFSSVFLGTVVGILCSFSSLIDNILMRICDGVMAIPAILLAVALTASLGPNVTNLVIALTIVFTPNVARIVRSKTLSLKSEPFVEASVAFGAKPLYIMWRHILPNTLSVLVVQATFIFADTIIVEAALSFLGAGMPAPEPSWGNILYEGKSVITRFPWMVAFTSMALVFTVIGLNLIGDGLRDLLDKSTLRASRENMLQRLFFPAAKKLERA